VPLHGEISFADLALRCDIHEPDLRRLLRFAMCYHRCFREPRKGFVAHTAASRSIVERPGVKDALGVMFDECWQGYARVWVFSFFQIWHLGWGDGRGSLIDGVIDRLWRLWRSIRVRR